MKKLLILGGFLFFPLTTFSQITQSDAAGFLSRNPVEKVSKFVIWNSLMTTGDRIVKTKSTYGKLEVVSFSALESGFSMQVKSDTGNKEKFFPYASIKYFLVSSNNSMNIYLFD